VRFDSEGRPFDEKPSNSVNISLGGVRLGSRYPIECEEIVEITIAIEENLVTMLGTVVHVARSKDQGFEFGVSARRIDHENMIPLLKYLRRILASGLNRIGPTWKGIPALRHDRTILKGDRIVCPHCGEQIGSLARIKDMIAYCKEFYGQCRCGQKYTIKLSLSNTTVLSFPDRQIDIAC
jgi:hypothetical protein